MGVEGSDEDMGAGHVSLWRVQVLPLETVRFRARDLVLTRQYLDDIAEAFDAGVFDEVPFLLDAGYVRDIRRGGDVCCLEPVADGLDAVVDATAGGDEAIRTVPGLAAAPRLIEGYRTADGRAFPVVLQHILGTASPVIPGLRGWRELEPAP